jgi:hypothetical protein
MRNQARLEVDEAVAAMKKRGLKVTKPNAEQMQEWLKLADTLYPRIRGKMVPAETFDEVVGLLKEPIAPARRSKTMHKDLAAPAGRFRCCAGGRRAGADAVDPAGRDRPASVIRAGHRKRAGSGPASGPVLAMFGALVAERGGHLTSLGAGLAAAGHPLIRRAALLFAGASSAYAGGMLARQAGSSSAAKWQRRTRWPMAFRAGFPGGNAGSVFCLLGSRSPRAWPHHPGLALAARRVAAAGRLAVRQPLRWRNPAVLAFSSSGC